MAEIIRLTIVVVLGFIVTATVSYYVTKLVFRLLKID